MQCFTFDIFHPFEILKFSFGPSTPIEWMFKHVQNLATLSLCYVSLKTTLVSFECAIRDVLQNIKLVLCCFLPKVNVHHIERVYITRGMCAILGSLNLSLLC
jgi:hypothetical protein